MRVDFGVYFVVMAVSLGLAYYASLPQNTSDSTVIAHIEPNLIHKITLTSDVTNVIAERRDDKRFWITYVEFKKPEDNAKEKDQALTGDDNDLSDGADGSLDATDAKAAPDEKEDAKTKAESVVTESSSEKEISKELRFLGNEKMDEYLVTFSPLNASRVIGKVEDEALAKEFGFETGKIADVQIFDKNNKQLLHVLVGKKSYGSRNYFVKLMPEEKVLLIDGDFFQAFIKAEFRLYERRITDSDFEEITHAVVKAGSEKRFSHTKRDKTGQLSWSDDSPTAAINPTYKSWMDKVDRLRLMSFADGEQLPELEQSPTLMEIALEKDGRTVDNLIFKKTKGTDKPEYWVKSNFLGTYAKLSENRVDPIEKDLRTVLGSGAGGSPSPETENDPGEAPAADDQ